MAITTAEAHRIADATDTAYSHDRYGAEEWLKCTIYLGELGYRRGQVVSILESKHMRWAADRRGDATVRGLTQYFENPDRPHRDHWAMTAGLFE